jgi:hypothetical protein
LNVRERGQESACRRRRTHLVGTRFSGVKSDGEAFEVVQREKEGDHGFRWNVPGMWDIEKVKMAKMGCRQDKVW